MAGFIRHKFFGPGPNVNGASQSGKLEFGVAADGGDMIIPMIFELESLAGLMAMSSETGAEKVKVTPLGLPRVWALTISRDAACAGGPESAKRSVNRTMLSEMEARKLIPVPRGMSALEQNGDGRACPQNFEGLC